jgi:murein L,D-transpeptidase YafK
VEVFKDERRMELKRDGKTIRRYRVALGFSPERHKEREGDGRTPEGSYTVDARDPQSAFDAEIREVWSLVPTGARVVIHP